MTFLKIMKEKVMAIFKKSFSFVNDKWS